MTDMLSHLQHVFIGFATVGSTITKSTSVSVALVIVLMSATFGIAVMYSNTQNDINNLKVQVSDLKVQVTDTADTINSINEFLRGKGASIK